MQMLSNFPSGAAASLQWDNNQGIIYFDLIKNESGATNHWFHFHCDTAEQRTQVTVIIRNARASLFARGWPDYRPFIYSQGVWRRAAAHFTYDGEKAILKVINPPTQFSLAWYRPYLEADMLTLLRTLDGQKDFRIFQINELEVVQAGNARAPLIVVLGRQHPGESMSSFFIEGFLKKLTDGSVESRNVLRSLNLLIFPMVNQDGVQGGFHRTDPQGNDYNICWNRQDISAIESIKAYLGTNARVALLLDIHGDEVAKRNYLFYYPKFASKKENKTVIEVLSGNKELAPAVPIPSDLRVFCKELIKNRRLHFPVQEAGGYFESVYGAFSIIYELNAHTADPGEHANWGIKLVEQLNRTIVKT